MRGTLVLMGGPGSPDPKVIDREKITHVAWEARDPQLTTQLLATWRPRNKVGSQRDPRWNGLSAVGLAEAMSEDITRLGGGKPGEPAKAQHFVMPDIEHTHDPAYVMTCYRRFRELRSGRGFYLTVEWHQSGWFSLELIDAINNDPLFFLLPQAYETDKVTAVDPRVVEQDCIDYDIDIRKVQVFLRHDRCDIGWSGWMYDYNNAR